MTYKLLEPGRIGKLELRNRIVMAPMGTVLGSAHGEVTGRLIHWYAERAKGGVGLVCVEDTLVTPAEEYGLEIAGQLRIHDYNYIPGFNELTESVHHYGAKISCQLNYPNAGIDPNLVPGVQGVTPSPFSHTGLYGPILTREASIEEIHALIQAYAEGALRARIAGFDAIELLAYNGGISCFFSPYTNKRTDLYGGDFEGRMRFAVEVVEQIKKKVGDDFPLIVRMAADEFVPGGVTLEEAKKIAKRFEESGVHAVSLCSGTYGTPISLAFGASWPVYQKKGFLEPYAAEIKKTLTIPVILVGGLHFIEIAERILRDGKADFIAMARGLIADPEIPRKLMEGRPEDIRRCIRCNECLSRVVAYLPISCSINVVAGMEGRFQIGEAKKRKKVVVVGGGPGGMEAARVAALRGHDVSLYEQGEQLGGNLIPGSMPEFKEELRYLREWFPNQLRKLGVKVELGKGATKELVLALKPDVVIIGTGSTPLRPDIPGIEKGFPAVEVLLGKVGIGEKAVVAGGGLVGCETALHLKEKGKEVVVVEMLDDILLDVNVITKAALIEKFLEKGIKWVTGMKLVEVTKDAAIGMDKAWRKHLFSGDTVLALGLLPEASLFESLRKDLPEVYAIGDCQKPRKIRQAIQEGFQVSSRI
jgi:2,4-dienoyl-CoA reductase-like NADH-dependent reductase (Old Yellow Enzyme family)/thioredoxin reductase